MIVNEHRMAGGLGIRDQVIRGLDFDAFAGGMCPASRALGRSTSVSLASDWIGGGFTWHFSPATAASRREAMASTVAVARVAKTSD